MAEDLSIPLSWELKLSSDGVFYIDWAKDMSSSDHQLVLDHLAGVSGLDTIPLSYIGGISVDEVIPLGWQTTFTGNKPLAWVLGSRGTLWVLSSRGELSWVLPSREAEWVLPAKSTDWKVNTRPSDWVLQGR